jgi:hypothetical protein
VTMRKLLRYRFPQTSQGSFMTDRCSKKRAIYGRETSSDELPLLRGMGFALLDMRHEPSATHAVRNCDRARARNGPLRRSDSTPADGSRRAAARGSRNTPEMKARQPSARELWRRAASARRSGRIDLALAWLEVLRRVVAVTVASPGQPLILVETATRPAHRPRRGSASAPAATLGRTLGLLRKPVR